MAIKKYHVSKNLYPLDINKLHVGRVETDGTIDYEVGTLSVEGDTITYTYSVSWRGFYTDFIPIGSATTLTMSPIPPNGTTSCSCYDNNNNFLGRADVTSMPNYRTFNLIEGTTKVRIAASSVDTVFSVTKPQLEVGNAATSYEPYGNTFKNWFYRKRETAADTITTLPKQIIADGQSASAVIKGNMSQSGTPTPASPLYPSECGNRTENLFDVSNPNIFRGYYDSNTNRLFSTRNNAFIYIPIETGKKYYVSGVKRASASTTIRWVTTTKIPSDIILCVRNGTFAQTDILTVTAESNENYLVIFVCGDSDYSAYGTVEAAITANCADLVIDNGYKIPILCGGTTTPVYLGEVQSTRQIKKIKASDITWIDGSTTGYNFYRGTLTIPKLAGGGISTLLSNKYRSVETRNNLLDGDIASYNLTTVETITVRDDRYSSAAEWLAANGDTEIWYILATPTTGIVNEPIRKIGTYSDSISNVTQIPTTSGSQTFDVQTDLKPSEVDLTYHGWHEHSDKKYSGGSWT